VYLEIFLLAPASATVLGRVTFSAQTIAASFRLTFITSAKEVMFLPDSVCLSVSKITQKVMNGSFWNFENMSGMAQTTSVSILGVIRKESWILDHFEIFVTIAFNWAYGKPLQSRRWYCHLVNNIAFAEVCGLWLLSRPSYYIYPPGEKPQHDPVDFLDRP